VIIDKNALAKLSTSQALTLAHADQGAQQGNAGGLTWWGMMAVAAVASLGFICALACIGALLLIKVLILPMLESEVVIVAVILTTLWFIPMLTYALSSILECAWLVNNAKVHWRGVASCTRAEYHSARL
jgi:hypothetical protein